MARLTQQALYQLNYLASPLLSTYEEICQCIEHFPASQFLTITSSKALFSNKATFPG